MIYTHAAAALFAAVVAATGAYQIQEWRYAAKGAEHAEQHLADERAAATAAIRRTEAVITAQSAAAVRSAALRRDADGARAAIVSLHAATEAAMRDAAVSKDACIVRAAAISQLLNQCGGAYQELGAIADRHASDVKTLMDAWPR